jgi:hypothetical protein
MPLANRVMCRITEYISPPANSQSLAKTSRMLDYPLALTDEQCPAAESKKRQNILTRSQSRIRLRGASA